MPAGKLTLVAKGKTPYGSKGKRYKTTAYRSVVKRQYSRTKIPTEIPNKQVIKFVYYQHIDTNAANVTAVYRQFSLNCLEKPDPTNQNRRISGWYGGYSLLFSKYKVYGAKVEWKGYVANNGVALTTGMLVSDGADDIPQSPGDLVEWITEAKGHYSKDQYPSRDGASYPTWYLKRYYALKNIVGSIRDDDFEGTTGDSTTPARNLVISLVQGVQATGSTSTWDSESTLRITYYARLYDPRTPDLAE